MTGQDARPETEQEAGDGAAGHLGAERLGAWIRDLRGVLDGVDVAGVALAVLLAVWAVIASRGQPGSDAVPLVGLALSVAVVSIAARLVTALHPWAAPAALTVTAGIIALVSWEGGLLGGPEGALGDPDVTAAFFVLAAAAAAMTSTRTELRPVQWLAGLVALGFGVVPVLLGSILGTSAALLLLFSFASRRGFRARRTLVAAGGFLTFLVLATTTLLGLSYDAEAGDPVSGIVDTVLTPRRVELWHGALQLLQEEPVSGVGPGRYAAASPAIEPAGPDSPRWADNDFLEVGAETGLVGLALALGLFTWGFVRLHGERPDHAAAVAGVALGTLGIYASLDHALHAWPVVLAAAAIVGAGSRSWQQRPLPG